MTYADVQIIGFDLDQTLYPKSPEIDAAIQAFLYERIAERCGVSFSEAERLFAERYQDGKGMSGRSTLVDLGFPEQEAKDAVQHALENADISPFLVPNPDTALLLAQLRDRKIILDIITGSNARNTMIKLKTLAIDPGLFAHIITQDDASKSDGSAFRMWRALYPEVALDRFLYIGDRISSDYETPKELGIASILVNIAAPDASVACPQFPSLTDARSVLF